MRIAIGIATFVVVFILPSIALAPNAGGQTLAELRLPNLGCDVVVNETDESNRRLTISCRSKVVFNYSTEDHLVDLSRDSSGGTRVIARWEGTRLFHVTIFSIKTTNTGIAVSTVIDRDGRVASDILTNPDVVLAFGDERLVGDVWTPTATDVYEWDGDAYKLYGRWKWGGGMSFKNRFCVLDAKSVPCPAAQITVK
jgi:hypothetical protein